MTISGADVSGTADILYCEEIKQVDYSQFIEDHMRLVAVCEVKALFL